MIVVYSQANCPACEKLKHELTVLGMPFMVVSIDKDQEAKSFLINQGFRSVPQMFINGKHITLESLTKETI